MAAERVIHIIGTGTIGEPLIGLFLNLREQLELDEITFHKNRPLLGDRAKVKNLIRRGAKLVVAAEKMSDFGKAWYAARLRGPAGYGPGHCDD